MMRIRAVFPSLRYAFSGGNLSRTLTLSNGSRSYRVLNPASFTAVPSKAMVPAAMMKAPASPWNVAAFARSMSDRSGVNGRKPTMEVAKAAPRTYYEMSNEVLLSYAAQGDHEARKERMLREIMVVDQVPWEDAHPKLNEMEAANKAGAFFFTLPYKAGIAVAITAGLSSIPLVFHLDTALWFNEHYVTTDVAEPEDLETFLEVGAWTWSWMEPPLGQISFFLLTLQFARNQMLNVGAKPYTGFLQTYRANRLVQKYPQYSKQIVSEFATTADWS